MGLRKKKTVLEGPPGGRCSTGKTNAITSLSPDPRAYCTGGRDTRVRTEKKKGRNTGKRKKNHPLQGLREDPIVKIRRGKERKRSALRVFGRTGWRDRGGKEIQFQKETVFRKELKRPLKKR